MTLDEVIILTQAGISVDIETDSALDPAGRLIAVHMQPEVEVRLFDYDGTQRPYVFKPNDWFRDGGRPDNKLQVVKVGEDG